MKDKKNKKEKYKVLGALFAIKKYFELFKEFIEIYNLTDEFNKFIKERSPNYEKDVENFNTSTD